MTISDPLCSDSNIIDPQSQLRNAMTTLTTRCFLVDVALPFIIKFLFLNFRRGGSLLYYCIVRLNSCEWLSFFLDMLLNLCCFMSFLQRWVKWSVESVVNWFLIHKGSSVLSAPAVRLWTLYWKVHDLFFSCLSRLPNLDKYGLVKKTKYQNEYKLLWQC